MPNNKVKKTETPPTPEAKTPPTSQVQEGANRTHFYMSTLGAGLLKNGGENPHAATLRGRVKPGG